MDEHGSSADAAGDGVAEPEEDETGSQEGAASSSADPIQAVRALIEQVLEESIKRVRGEGGKLGGRASDTFGGVLTEVGVAKRRDQEDLELRMAQLEHRVRLLEGHADAGDDSTSAASNQSRATDS